MRILQKLVLMIYAFAIFFIAFVSVPYTCNFEGGIKKYIGHHIRPRVHHILGIEDTKRHRFFSAEGRGRLHGFCNIDASMIFIEVLALTGIAGAVYLFLQRKKNLESN